MPIYSLEGTPGAGKTLYMVQKIIPDFIKQRGYDGSIVPRHIYTNIEGLKPELLCILAGMDLTEAAALRPYFHQMGEVVDSEGNKSEDKRYIRYFYYERDSIEWIDAPAEKGKAVEKIPNPEKAKLIPPNSLVIIDELQNYFSSRDFATQYSKLCIDAITKNRHYGWSIWWASQNVEAVEVTFRRNTEQVWFLEKLENYGRSNTASIKIYEGYMVGTKTSLPPMATRKYSYDYRFYATYNSYAQKGVTEKRYKTNILLHHKGFMIIAVIIILCIVFVVINGNPLDKMTKNRKTQQRQAVAAEPAPLKGFTPQGAGRSGNDPQEEKVEEESYYYESEYTHDGVRYVVIDGIARPREAGKVYVQAARKKNY